MPVFGCGTGVRAHGRRIQAAENRLGCYFEMAQQPQWLLYLRQDPRTYTKAITERHCAEDTHQHVAAYEHSSPLALMRVTNVAFTDPLWVIQVQAALLAGLKSGILMQKSAFVFKIPLFAFLNPHLTGHSDGY